MSDKTERVLINALVIGGSLALTYFVISQWGKSKPKKRKAKDKANGSENGADDTVESNEALAAPSMISQIGTKVINQATLILLDIAKEKLIEFLESRKKRDENS